MTSRSDRRHSGDRPADQRDAFQRDRDRVLYTSALRRLADVSQVVYSGETYLFHNRLTHTLEVAQLGLRLAEKLADGLKDTPYAGCCVPQVVEGAALAHDLGHPPFGHVAEHELNRLAECNGLKGGFEGNAQSFRIVTKLALRSDQFRGLNLTRATLCAILKYPWLWSTKREGLDKYGAYRSEEDDFKFARAISGENRESACLEAQIMDLADDIAYAVHDVEDCYQVGMIPLERLAHRKEERDKFLEGTFQDFKNRGEKLEFKGITLIEDELRDVAHGNLFGNLGFTERYTGTAAHQALLKNFTSVLIGDFVGDARVDVKDGKGPQVQLSSLRRNKIWLLRQLTFYYVINDPDLATQQFGQRYVIRTLFDTFLNAATSPRERMLFSPMYRERLEQPDTEDGLSDDQYRVRTVVDFIAGLTETQALALFRRITGQSFGSVLEALS